MAMKSTESRALAQERRTADKMLTTTRHTARMAKYSPTRGNAGAW